MLPVLSLTMLSGCGGSTERQPYSRADAEEDTLYEETETSAAEKTTAESSEIIIENDDTQDNDLSSQNSNINIAPDDFSYEAVESEGRTTRRIEWKGLNGDDFWLEVTFNVSAYEYYSQLPRIEAAAGENGKPDHSKWIEYINDQNNRDFLKVIADALIKCGNDYGYSRQEMILEAVRYVQSIEYVTDKDFCGETEYPKYPIETVYDNCGDCEDVSFLLAGILREMGCDVCFLYLPGHFAVGIAGDDTIDGVYYQYNDKKYYYAEATNDEFLLGQTPVNVDCSEAIMYFPGE